MRTVCPDFNASRYARASANQSLICSTCSAYVFGGGPGGPPRPPGPPPPPRPPRPVAFGSGHLTFNAAAPFIDISSHVHPSSDIAEDKPEITPPSGVLNATSTPALRVVPICRLSAFTATSARMLGLKSPISRMSFDTSTEPISAEPDRAVGVDQSRVNVFCPTSPRFLHHAAPQLPAPPMAVILPRSITIVPFVIVPFVTV